MENWIDINRSFAKKTKAIPNVPLAGATNPPAPGGGGGGGAPMPGPGGGGGGGGGGAMEGAGGGGGGGAATGIVEGPDAPAAPEPVPADTENSNLKSLASLGNHL